MSNSLFNDDQPLAGAPDAAGGIHTWPCPACEYVNLGEATHCERCGTERGRAEAQSLAPADQTIVAASIPAPPPAPDATLAQAASPILAMPPATPAPAPAPRRERKTSKAMAGVALAVILLALAGLGYTGYRAWDYGYLDDYLPQPWRAASQPGTADAKPAAGAPDATAPVTAPEPDHPLQELSASKEPKLKALKQYVAPLLTAEEAMNQFGVEQAELGVLSTDTLTQLTTLQVEGLALLDEYVKFEAQAKEMTAEVQAPYITLVRAQFEADFLRLISLIGLAYSSDMDGEHPAYDLHIKIPWTLKEYGQIDPQQYDDAWIAAIKERKQTELDIAHSDIYDDLLARQRALATIQDAFKSTLKSLPSYQSRQGILDTNGHQLLRLLDSYAGKLEDLDLEFEEYRAKLVLAEEPRRFKQHCDEYVKSLQQEHLYCFTEIYRIYVDDEELTDPVYTRNLEVHYAFIKEHWPKLDFDYRKIAAQYEDEWARRWRGHGSAGETAEEPTPPPDGAADEIPWMR